MSWFRRKPDAAPLDPGQAIRAEAGASASARLDADPRVERIPVDGAQAYRCRDFLNAKQCAALIRLIDRGRRPSTLLSDRAGKGFRTSESCDLDRWAPDVRPIDESIAALLGMRFERGETMQGQRYAPGQQFRAHHDYFDPRESYWDKVSAQGGQRTWTAMIYLNDVEEGGATWFPHAGMRVAPQRGLLLAWNNMGPDGRPNPATLHEGMPVVAGVKYVVTKWFREGDWITS